MMVCLFAASSAKSLMIDRVAADVLPDVAGAAQVIAVALVLVVLYGQRWRPAVSVTSAWAGNAIDFAKSLIPSITSETLLLLAFHLAQVVVVYFMSGSSPDASQLLSCGSTTSLLWAPLIEELIFRVVLFYVVLQRSGGRVGLACLASACTFGAIHVANVYATGGSLYGWLQVAAGVSCGAAWTLAYATTGSLSLVAALHSANNLAAVAWMSLKVGTGQADSCEDQAFSLELLVSLMLQVGLYMAASWALWGRLHRLTTAAPELPGNAAEVASASPSPGSFRSLHPLVYEHGIAPQSAAEAGAEPNVLADATVAVEQKKKR